VHKEENNEKHFTESDHKRHHGVQGSEIDKSDAGRGSRQDNQHQKDDHVSFDGNHMTRHQ
jgi:hypothetical protein